MEGRNNGTAVSHHDRGSSDTLSHLLLARALLRERLFLPLSQKRKLTIRGLKAICPKSRSWGCPNPKPHFGYATSHHAALPWASPPAPSRREFPPTSPARQQGPPRTLFLLEVLLAGQLLQTLPPFPDSARLLRWDHTLGPRRASALTFRLFLTGPQEPFLYSQIECRLPEDTTCHPSEPL